MRQRKNDGDAELSEFPLITVINSLDGTTKHEGG